MNKAFTKESDYDPSLDIVARPRDLLPPGVKNYITPKGAVRLRAELKELLDVVRPRLLEQIAELVVADRQEDAAHHDAKRHLRQVEQQAAWLEERVAALEVVDPATHDGDRVRFGATVTVLDQEDEEQIWRIVGIDEAEPSQGDVSWISPIARALLSKEVGDEVTVELPRGQTRLEILSVEYP